MCAFHCKKQLWRHYWCVLFSLWRLSFVRYRVNWCEVITVLWCTHCSVSCASAASHVAIIAEMTIPSFRCEIVIIACRSCWQVLFLRIEWWCIVSVAALGRVSKQRLFLPDLLWLDLSLTSSVIDVCRSVDKTSKVVLIFYVFVVTTEFNAKHANIKSKQLI